LAIDGTRVVVLDIGAEVLVPAIGVQCQVDRWALLLQLEDMS
jgi:hypothetical protein